MFYGKNVGVIPLTDANWISKKFSWPSHKGIDIGWSATYYKYENCPVLAWQDGVVVDKGYGSEIGNFIVLEHIYSNGKRWTGYIHLANMPNVNRGDKFELGKPIGNARRGNTGKSNGTHLHLYLTKIVPLNTRYSWNTMLENCIDPYPYLYYSKDYNTVFIDKEYWKKELKMIVYPKPVKRNEKVHQVDIKSDTRRLRKTPSLSGEAYDEYCEKGIYNVYAMTYIDDYTWALIAEIEGNKFWVAVMSGEDLPEKKIVYPQPVERDESKNQVYIKSDTRKLRTQPSLQAEEYDELCKRGVYDVMKWETADGYDWRLIAVIDENEFWVAVMEGEDLPATDWKKMYENEVKKNNELIKEIEKLNAEIKALNEEIKKLNNKLETVKSAVNSLAQIL